jgi:hypothetical protein
MALYLGNIAIGNGNYLGNENITDNNIFMPTTTTTTAAPTTTTTTVYPPQYWVVQPCGGGAESSLAIDVGTTLTVGQAIRPVTQPFGTTPLPGYFTPTCWSLIRTTTSGTYCGIRAPAASCAQSVCSIPNTTTTTTASP